MNSDELYALLQHETLPLNYSTVWTSGINNIKRKRNKIVQYYKENKY